MNRAEVATMVQGREREIVQLVDEGLTNKAIARHLVVELATVQNHMHNIRKQRGLFP